MGLAEDLKALQELRDKGELSESAYAAARDAAVGKQAQPPPAVKPRPRIGIVVKVLIAIVVLFVGANIFSRIQQSDERSRQAFLHHPDTLTDELQNLPANSWKSFNYGFPQGGKLDVIIGVVNGNPIDVFLTDQDQAEAMKKGDWGSVKTYTEFNATKTKTYRRSGYLRPGNYSLVLRDTTLGVLSAPATDVSVKTILTP